MVPLHYINLLIRQLLNHWCILTIDARTRPSWMSLWPLHGLAVHSCLILLELDGAMKKHLPVAVISVSSSMQPRHLTVVLGVTPECWEAAEHLASGASWWLRSPSWDLAGRSLDNMKLDKSWPNLAVPVVTWQTWPGHFRFRTAMLDCSFRSYKSSKLSTQEGHS